MNHQRLNGASSQCMVQRSGTQCRAIEHRVGCDTQESTDMPEHPMPMSTVRVSAQVSACVVVVLLASPLGATQPSVQFDTAPTVGCRDVTPEDFAKTNPHHRLVEARIRVSALVPNADRSNEWQSLYQFISPAASLQIVDFDPKTELATDIAGNISIDKKNETTKSLGVSLSGSFNHLMRGTGGVDLGSKNGAQVRYELKPRKSAILAAGTIGRGTGVYFKLRPSAETCLEGERDFRLVMRVPDTWRGDILYVRCEAQQIHHGSVTAFESGRFIVGLYSAGDDRAMAAAERLVRAEAMLRRSGAAHRRGIQRRALPTFVHRVGAMLDVYQSKLPETWLEQIIYGPTDLKRRQFSRYLPDEVQQAAEQFGQAKRRMIRLNGNRSTERDGVRPEVAVARSRQSKVRQSSPPSARM